MWKLPFFGESDMGRVLAELEECARSYPDHHIRLLGYDNYTQSQGVAFVVREGRV
jgi:ribulose-bisphosphate carboxylase small chain